MAVSTNKSDSSPIIRINHLSVSYGSIQGLDDISLNITGGEFVLVTGPSGCGKSTLARVLTGLIPHAIPALMQGTVEINGLDTLQHPIPELAQVVGAVFQNPAAQLFHLRVEDEVAFGPLNLGLEAVEVRQRVSWALEATGLSNLRQQKPAELSRGQQQRLAIASALAMKPRLLVLDEPTASLDVPGTQAVMSTLQHLQQDWGVTIVIVEHRLAEIAPLAGRLVLMNEGCIIADGKPEETLADHTLRTSLGLRRPVHASLATWETLLAPDGHQASSETPLLSVQSVSAGYNHQAVLEDVSLAIYPGEFAALVGDNGAGKSTLALVAAGLIQPSQGQVFFLGKKRPRPGLDVALLFQDPTDQLFTDSVEEEVAFGAYNYGAFNETLLKRTLAEADLENLRQRRPMSLSVGQQQRTALAACLALGPRLLILDEPTLGQDWGHLQRLMDYLVTLNRQGTAILLITHDYKLVHHYARRVLLMKNGCITLDGYPRDSQRKEQA
jgi:energy-coupling factor transporter ATP-binding protein EcfA2